MNANSCHFAKIISLWILGLVELVLLVYFLSTMCFSLLLDNRVSCDPVFGEPLQCGAAEDHGSALDLHPG